MKKQLLWALAAIVVSACSVEEKPCTEASVPEGFKVLTIQAARDAGATRTAYADDKVFSWSVGDRISVLCNDGSQNLWQTFTTTTEGKSSPFVATVSANVEIGPLDSSQPKVALFPASEDHIYDGTDFIGFHLPAERDFRASSGGHPSADLPLFAWGTEDNHFAFSHLTGAAKITFNQVPCQQVKLTFENTCSLKLNGTYELYRDGDLDVEDASNVKWSAASTETESEKSVVYYADVENGSVSFYVPYATGSLWAWNKVTLENSQSAETIYSNNQVGQIDIQQRQLTVLTPLTIQQNVFTFESAYGISWDGIDAATPEETYAAIQCLKATADGSNLYLYMEVDRSKLTLSYNFAHYFNLYAEDAGGSANYWGDTPVSLFGKQSWAVVEGGIAFTNWDATFSSANLQEHAGTWYYEVRISRTHEKTQAVLGAAGTVSIGVVLDDLYVDNTSGSEVWARLNDYYPVGVIPAYGGSLYPVTLP